MNQVEVKRRRIEICSWIIGLINILIFGSRLGNNGIAYLGIALAGFSVIRILISGGLAETLSRMLRVRNTKGQYKNAMYIRRRVMILQGSLGIIASILFAVCAGAIAQKLFQVQYCTFIMILLAPALFMRTISNVLTGYFQGEGSELPGVVVAPLRQVMIMGLGLVFVRIVGDYGAKVSALLQDTAYTAMYSGVGVVVAINITEFFVLLFLGLLTLANRRSRSRRGNEGMKQTDSFLNTVKVLYGSMWGTMLIHLFEVLPIWFGGLFYRKSVTDVSGFAENYGVLMGKYFVICGILVLIICVILISMVARIVGAYRKEDYRSVKGIFQKGFYTTVTYALFCTVLVAVMAEQIAGMICKTNAGMVAEMFRYGSTLIFFVALFFFFSRLLMFMGKRYHLLGCMGLANILFIILNLILLNVGKLGVMSIIYSAIVAIGTGCVVLGLWCCRLLHTRIEWLQSLAIPAGTACVVGLICMLLGKLFTPHLGYLVTLLVCGVIAAIVYLIILKKSNKFFV